MDDNRNAKLVFCCFFFTFYTFQWIQTVQHAATSVSWRASCGIIYYPLKIVTLVVTFILTSVSKDTMAGRLTVGKGCFRSEAFSTQIGKEEGSNRTESLRNGPNPGEVWASRDALESMFFLFSYCCKTKTKTKNTSPKLRGHPDPWTIQESGQKLICKAIKQNLSFLHQVGLPDKRES